jgi:RNA polymerase sigma-70 factor (ECF subfamily)
MNSQPKKKPDTAPPPSQFQRDLIALIPHLRAFSRALCGRRAIAEDMAQEALMKAWRAQASFQPGTNLKAWLFTILRNEIYSNARRAWREAHWDADKAERIPAAANKQEWTMDLSDTARALRGLPETQREALILVAAGGFSYEEAAGICGAPVGTVKSRVARARTALVNILDGDTPLPPAFPTSMPAALDDILGQLGALAPAGTASLGCV